MLPAWPSSCGRGSVTLGPVRSLLLVLLAAGALGCDRSREDYRDDLAQAWCDRDEVCGNLGSYSGGTYESCEIRRRDDANNLWSAERCSDGRVNGSAADRCIERAATRSCSGVGGIGDFIDFLGACSASDVCTGG